MSMRGTKVWDLPVRLTHWALVILVLLSFGTAELGWLDMQWHFYSGYGILVLVLFRVLWGFFGSKHARFSSFLRGPHALIAYLRGQLPRSVGHNPVGGWSAIFLLAVLLLQAGTGLFNNDDIEWFGPLAEKVSGDWVEWCSDVHESAGKVLLALIGLHVLAVLGYLLFKRDDLISPMFSGYRRDLDAPDGESRPWWLALALLAVSAAALWSLIRFWPELD